MRSSLALVFLIACGGGRADEEQEAAPVARGRGDEREAAAEPAEPAACGAARAYEGASVLETPDGARVHYRVAGPADGPVLLYLHGGPGANAYSFERTAGPLLERTLRVVYLDQRGCGRSAGGRAALPLGMEPTVQDIERLRVHLGIERWSIAAHAYGGVIALVYATRHLDAIERIVMIEATADLTAALENQVRALGENPSVTSIASGSGPPLERLFAIYQTLGRAETQRRAHWASDEGQQAGERLDFEAQLDGCTRDGVLASYRDAGWTESRPELMRPLGRPVLLVAGRRSRVIGAELAERTAHAWDGDIAWMEESGHYPFVEEPEELAAAVIGFVRAR